MAKCQTFDIRTISLRDLAFRAWADYLGEKVIDPTHAFDRPRHGLREFTDLEGEIISDARMLINIESSGFTQCQWLNFLQTNYV